MSSPIGGLPAEKVLRRGSRSRRQWSMRPADKAPKKGDPLPGRLFHSQRVFTLYRRRKLTSMVASTVTGLPSFLPGENFHFWTASMAFSSRPKPKLLTT